MGDVFVRQMPMPSTIHGTTVVDADGNYNVYINECLCDEKKRDTLRHEMRHITCGHFYDVAPIEQNEREAEAR